MADPAGPDSEAALIRAAVDRYNRGDYAEAERLCLRALQANPQCVQALHVDGLTALARGDVQGAQHRLARAVAIKPTADILADLAAVLLKAGDIAWAVDRSRQALALDPSHANAHLHLGTALHQQQKFGAAAASLAAAVRLKPESMTARLGLARALLATNEFEAVQSALEPLLRSGSPHPRAYVLHAIASHEQCNFPAAIRYLEKALAVEPRSAGTLLDLANVYRDSGNFARATELYERALALDPSFGDGRNEYAHALLVHGRFERGWEMYEYRWEALGKESPQNFPRRLWNGEPLQGKRLLVWPEQGLGDQIMFAGLLPEIERMGARYSLVSSPKLVKLFARSFPAAQVTAQKSDAHHALVREAFDYQAPIASLARHLRKNRDDFPRHDGYLRPDPERVRAWSERLATLGTGKKIGISWRGGTGLTRRRLRSMDLEAWLPLLRTQGVKFVSLQYTDCTEEIAALRSEHGIEIHHWQEAIDDYDETAALVCALDLVVSVCTSVIHLTGALGKPVWVLVPVIPEWRYLAEGESMPWYPSARLFRQKRYRQWAGVMDRVTALLRDFADRG
jgi:tetratricopeptide (TPR) repeat protein